jgi:hypothetical protein
VRVVASEFVLQRLPPSTTTMNSVLDEFVVHRDELWPLPSQQFARSHPPDATLSVKVPPELSGSASVIDEVAATAPPAAPAPTSSTE